MIQVSPQIKLKDFQFAGRVYKPQRVHLTGMRWLIEARSDSGQVIWKDFPASHGLYAPCVYEPDSAKVGSLPGMEWWSEPLAQLFHSPRNDGPRIDVHRRRDAKSWIILNTLDTIFGHSFLLLFNAQFYLDHFPEHGLIIIATPEMLRFVPPEVHEVWEVALPARETAHWQSKLDELFLARCQMAEVFVASAPNHPDPSRYDIRRFGLNPGSGPVNVTAPQIIFLYRGTRLWGGSFASERTRLSRLGTWLKQFWPTARLEIFGHAGLPAPIPGWVDRTRRDERDYDAQLLEALASSDLVFGAHGSSMLLPSAICRLLLELVPLDKQPSLLQDFLFDQRALELRQHIWRHRFLYGNSTLNDISPRQVAQLINAMISMQSHFDFYQTKMASDPLRDPEEIERVFASELAPKIAAWNARLKVTLDLPVSARFWQFLRRLSAERD